MDFMVYVVIGATLLWRHMAVTALLALYGVAAMVALRHSSSRTRRAVAIDVMEQITTLIRMLLRQP